jgi:hypothetical protein
MQKKKEQQHLRQEQRPLADVPRGVLLGSTTAHSPSTSPPAISILRPPVARHRRRRPRHIPGKRRRGREESMREHGRPEAWFRCEILNGWSTWINRGVEFVRRPLRWSHLHMPILGYLDGCDCG